MKMFERVIVRVEFLFKQCSEAAKHSGKVFLSSLEDFYYLASVRF